VRASGQWVEASQGDRLSTQARGNCVSTAWSKEAIESACPR
jgi:hypothetical protein